MARVVSPAGAVCEVTEEKAARLGWPLADGETPPAETAGDPPGAEPTTPASDLPIAAPIESGPPAGNASRTEWATYAESLGIDVPGEARRDDIVALIAADLGQ